MQELLFIQDHELEEGAYSVSSEANQPMWQNTDLQIFRAHHCWMIKNFSFSSQNGTEKLESPSFFLGPRSELEFRIRLYPMGKDKARRNSSSYYYERYGQDTKECISLYLGMMTSFQEPTVTSKFKISLQNSKREEIKSLTCRTDFHARHFKGWNEFMKIGDLYKPRYQLLPSDRLLVDCEIVAAVSLENLDPEDDKICAKIPRCRLQDDMETLLDSKKLTDLVLKVNGTEIRVHKVILAARSPVFAAMFEHDMLEKNKGSVEIVDIDPDVILVMVRYMYSNKTPPIDAKMAEELLIAADKYGIEPLKTSCENVLSRLVTPATVSSMLSIACKYNAQKLKTNCIKIVLCFYEEILDRKEWNALIECYPQLLQGLIHQNTSSV